MRILYSSVNGSWALNPKPLKYIVVQVHGVMGSVFLRPTIRAYESADSLIGPRNLHLLGFKRVGAETQPS